MNSEEIRQVIQAWLKRAQVKGTVSAPEENRYTVTFKIPDEDQVKSATIVADEESTPEFIESELAFNLLGSFRRLPYRGFQIEEHTYQLAESREWAGKIQIWRANSLNIVGKPFIIGNTFASKNEAVLHAFNFGKQVIDGQVDGCSVEDL